MTIIIVRIVRCVCIAFLFGCQAATAQTPTFYYSAYPTGTNGSAANGVEFREQCLYTAADFPGLPAGRVKAIYIRVADTYATGTTGKCVMEAFMAKIGNVADSSFKTTYDTFRTGLTTIYGPDTFSFPCTGVSGQWIKIPVTKGNFHYNPEGAKFAVEVAAGPQSSGNYASFPRILNSNPSKGNLRLIYAFKRTNKMGSIIWPGMDLGFDLGQPAEVEAFSNITSTGLFPNPSTDGRFNISLAAQRPLDGLTITVTSATGQRILQHQYADAGRSVFKEIDLGPVAPGIYFVEIMADRERIVRRVVVQ